MNFREPATPAPTYELLGVKISILSMQNAIDKILDAALSKRKGIVCVTGVHGVMEARKDQKLREILNNAFLCTPDGMPTVWIGHLTGHKHMSRVYGPDLMLGIMSASQKMPIRHFLYGGQPGIALELKKNLEQKFPGVQICGTFCPPFRPLNEDEKTQLVEEVEAAKPDIFWVGLSTPKQEKFMWEYLPLLDTSIMIGVGAAFDFHTGRIKQAPKWMQDAGLEWLFRLLQEPRRLWKRYFTIVPKFLILLIWEILIKQKVWSRCSFLFCKCFCNKNRVLAKKTGALLPGLKRITDRKIKKNHSRISYKRINIALLGSRGIPRCYSGFETFYEELGKRLVERGHCVTVYNRVPFNRFRGDEFEGVKIVKIPTLPTKWSDTIVHTALSCFHALFQRYDILYFCGVGNALFTGYWHLFGAKTILNVDGADWERAKWRGFAKWFLRWSEWVAARQADVVIADHPCVAERYKENYGVESVLIPYGAEVIDRDPGVECLEKFGLKKRGYFLYVSRLTPENRAAEVMEAYLRAQVNAPLVVVGDAPYERNYVERLKGMEAKSGGRIVMTGYLFGTGYRQLSFHALAFVYPTGIDATRPVVLEQMGMGGMILARDTTANRQVLEDCGMYFALEEEGSLEGLLEWVERHPEKTVEFRRKAQGRIAQFYSWDAITERYEKLFYRLVEGGNVFDKEASREVVEETR